MPVVGNGAEAAAKKMLVIIGGDFGLSLSLSN